MRECDRIIRRSSSLAEADGNRTRLGARAPTTVLKTAGPTRNPDASAEQPTGWWSRSAPDDLPVPLPDLSRA